MASYVFPAGGRRGTTVAVRVGGLFLHRTCSFELLGPGVDFSRELKRTRTVWFEGPLLPLPASQQAEDYPRDMAGEVRIAADAPLGVRRGRVWTAEGAASGLAFVVGDLPEVIEEEVAGDPLPVEVRLPVTANGRIFPREDVDLWAFQARAGAPVTAEVHAARLGSPLDARLEVLDAEGRVLAENDDARGADPLLHFTPSRNGLYRVRIRDTGARGGQSFVYRLTLTAGPRVDHVYPLGGRRDERTAFTLHGVGLPSGPVTVTLPADAHGEHGQRFPLAGGSSNPVRLDLDDLPEHRETEPNDQPGQGPVVKVPAVVNGRIDRPGDVDGWRFAARKGEAVALELRAAGLGSPVQGVLTVCDEQGKERGRAEAAGAGSDPTLLFTPPVDGVYCVQVRDRFHSRGGSSFAYRLRLAPPVPDFRLRLAADALTVPRGGQARLRILAERQGGFKEPIPLSIEGLPAGVTAARAVIGPGQPAVDVTLRATKSAPIGAVRLSVRGTATIAGRSLTRTASLPLERSAGEIDNVLLGVALPAPFKVVGAFDLRLAPRGTVFRRTYRVERNGYDGPLEVSLADRQARHLQGVTGPTLTVPAGASTFEYSVSLPPWMETGRTSRSCIMAVGVVKEGGQEYTVSYTSPAQNDQIIAVVETGRLGIETGRQSIEAVPGGIVAVSVRVRRGKGLQGPVRVELPDHVRGLHADPLVLPPSRDEGTLTLRFARTGPGLGTVPVTVRATLLDHGDPVTAETKLEVVTGE